MNKIIKKIKKWTFQKLLTVIFVVLFSTAFLGLGITIIQVSEEKIRDNVKGNMSVVVKQYNVYLENYITDIFDGFTSFESNTSLIQLELSDATDNTISNNANCNLAVHTAFSQFLETNSSSVYAVYANFNDGHFIQQANQEDVLKIQYEYDEWLEQFPEDKYYWVDADDYRELIPDEEVGAVLFRLYHNVDSNKNGIMLIAIKKDFFANILDVTSLNTDACISLITDYGIMHFGNETSAEKVEENRDYIHLQEASSVNVTSEIMDHYYFIYEDMSLTGWKLVYCVSEHSISDTASIRKNVLTLSVCWVIIESVLIGILSKAISHPLRILTKTVEKEDVLKYKISIQSYAEIASLSNSLEKMRERINILLKQVEIEQEQRSQIEIALVQEQVSPHFMYNTLYACMQLCEMNEIEKAIKMLSALSNFYRIGLNNGNRIITVSQELEHIKNYLAIQHFRYSDIFNYTIDCEEEILSCIIPKMSLQPLVENAIYHGVKQSHEFGNICILGGSRDGKTAYLEVHDDGPGISQERITEIEQELQNGECKTSGICFGLKNIHSRIQYEFGHEYGLEIYSKPGDTCVRICFAMEKE